MGNTSRLKKHAIVFKHTAAEQKSNRKDFAMAWNGMRELISGEFGYKKATKVRRRR